MSLLTEIHADLEKGALRLIAEYRDRLFADAIRLCGDVAAAEDLVSKTFDKVIRNLDSYKEDNNFLGWMKTIMVNLHHDEQRSPVRRATTPVDPKSLEENAEADWSADELILKHSDSEALKEAISRLDPEYKKVLVMHYFGELPAKNIALALNLPLGTVLWRLSIARRMLAKDLGAKFGKKPVVVVLAVLLAAGALFGAWQAGVGEWLTGGAEKTADAFGESVPPPLEVVIPSRDDVLPVKVPMCVNTDQAPRVTRTGRSISEDVSQQEKDEMKLLNQNVPFGTWGRSMTCMALASCLTYGACAMTFSDLQEAVLTAQDGDTVWVMNDMEYTGTLDVGAKHLTLASADGAAYTLTRAAGHGGALFEINDPRADVTIRDLVIDGNKGAGNFTTRPFVTSAGRLTFSSGAVFQNFKSSSMSGPWYQTGGTNVLEAGSLIRGCENSLWGTAVLLGGSAIFFMNGGMITECVGTCSNASSDYDGVVYLNGDSVHFWMSGGTITGNTSVNSVAGVNIYRGYFHPGLDACVTNNQGGFANDVSLSKGRMIVATEWGDFTGYLTLHVPSEPVVGTDTYPTIQAWCSRDYPALGLGNIVCEQWPQYVWDGRSLSGHYYAKWTHRVDLAGRNISGSLPEVCQRAEDGDVLVPFTNMVVSGTAIVSDGKRLTLAGQGRRIARTMGGAIFSVTNASLRLENVVLDGNKASVTNQATSGMITLDAKANVELGEGTVIENAVSLYNTAGVGVLGESSRLTMEDGAVIRNCELVQTDGYGVAVRIGGPDSETQDIPAVFRMTGGAITGNVAVTTKSVQVGYGGTIYCYGGTFEMSGGTVSQNVCAESSSGVNLYQGRLILSGTARIENNLPSAYPDVYIGDSCKENVVISGDFRGHVGVSSCAGSVNANTEIVCEEGATGACRIFNARGDAPYGSLSAYMWSHNRKVYLYSAVAWIDGIGCPQYGAGGYVYEDIATLAPSTVDLDSPVGLASLPHTFKGTAARAFSGTLTVSFDPEQWTLRPELPLTLLVTEDGPFTGNWSFVLPDATSGSWKVKKVNCANQNEAYVLSWLKPGVVLIIR